MVTNMPQETIPVEYFDNVAALIAARNAKETYLNINRVIKTLFGSAPNGNRRRRRRQFTTIIPLHISK